MGAKQCKEACAYIAGIMFAVGWFLWIDAHVYLIEYVKKENADDVTPSITFAYYIPALVTTLGLIMTNVINLETLNPYSWLFDEHIGGRVKAWLFLSFFISFGGLVAAIWIMAAIFMPPHNQGDQWPGIALCLQNLLILLSSLLLLATRSERSSEEYQDL